MNDLQIERINRLRRDGKGYRVIAAELDLPVNSVKSWCRRHPYGDIRTNTCLFCGTEIISQPHKRQRKFCSDKCRLAWWKENPDKRKNKTVYAHVCRFCGSKFINNRIKADYCCRECFAKARMRVTADGQ